MGLLGTESNRAVVWLGQHLARSKKNLGKRHLILTDSMTACFALAKGRSSIPSVNRIFCQIVALLHFSFKLVLSFVFAEYHLNLTLGIHHQGLEH